MFTIYAIFIHDAYDAYTCFHRAWSIYGFAIGLRTYIR